MKSALILALAGSAVAAPSFKDFLDALFGGGNNSDQYPKPSDFPGIPPLGTGTGTGVPFPFPTATGAPFPFPGSDGQAKRNVKPLHIDYELAPKAVRVVKRRELKYRQLDGSALPSFSLFDPNNTPTATEPATDLPTEVPTEIPGLPTGTGAPAFPTGVPTDLPGLPTGGPTAPIPFPTGEAPFPTDAPFPTAPIGTDAPGLPGLPTTFGTVTRGPKPTTAPDESGEEGDETENGNAWLDWISDLLTGGKGSQH